MTKSEFVSAIAEKMNMKKYEAEPILNVLQEIIEDTMRSRDKITLPGIGTFSVKEVPEKRGKIMLGDRKGKEYCVPAHLEPKFKPLKAFKNMLV